MAAVRLAGKWAAANAWGSRLLNEKSEVKGLAALRRTEASDFGGHLKGAKVWTNQFVCRSNRLESSDSRPPSVLLPWRTDRHAAAIAGSVCACDRGVDRLLTPYADSAWR